MLIGQFPMSTKKSHRFHQPVREKKRWRGGGWGEGEGREKEKRHPYLFTALNIFHQVYQYSSGTQYGVIDVIL